MSLFLGVDGGGTGCRAAVADAAGRVLGRGRSASANIVTDANRAQDNILHAAQAALDDAGASAQLGDLVAVLGIAGANLPERAARLSEGLPFAVIRLETDAMIAARGALGDADGVVASLGTGSVFAAQRTGAMQMAGGWGFVLGDQGSGARMGRDLLELALLAHDGLEPLTPLLLAVVAEAGGPEALVAFAQAASPADFARFAPRILEAAEQGDTAAAGILATGEAAVAAAITHLLDGDDLPVCFLGGLGRAYEKRLSVRFGGLVRAPLGTPLDGALAMARELAA